MEENKDGDNEKELNDTDDVKTGDLQKTINNVEIGETECEW